MILKTKKRKTRNLKTEKARVAAKRGTFSFGEIKKKKFGIGERLKAYATTHTY